MLYPEGVQPFRSDSSAKSLQKINERLNDGLEIGGGFSIPQYDSVTVTYVGSTNNVNTVVYKLNTTTVATLTVAYVGGAPSTNGALVSTVTQS